MQDIYRAPGLAIQLGENDSAVPARIQVIRTGQFHDSRYGKFEITKDHLAAFKKNFDARVRGIDLALDYGHKSDGEAAAWFKNLELSDDGNQLWAVPDWTPEGGKSVTTKRYRYVSADFNLDYQDNETLTKHGPTLLGAGLTNRPVVKGQAPVVELSEGVLQVSTANVDPKDKEISDLKAKIAELEAKLAVHDKGAPVAPAEIEKQLSETNLKLSEATSKLADFEARAKKDEADKLVAEKKAKFDVKLSEGSVVEAQREHFMSGDMEKFMEASRPIKLSEHGTGQPPAGGDQDAKEKVLALAEKAVTEKRAKDFQSAVRLVLSEDADLKREFEKLD